MTTRAREQMPVEIALLVSLLLHAMAYGTWQYRAELAKLPPFSLLEKIMRVIQPARTFTTAHPQTITFVEVEEPRAKERQAQREKETEAARRFMETDASQVTGAKPPDAKYYSDKSTVAANPNNPTGKEGDTPYLQGQGTLALSSIDVPTPSGVPQPPIFQRGSPGAPANASSPAPPAPKVTQATPQSKASESPKQVAPSGLKMVEDQPLAMATKPATPAEAMTGRSAAEAAAAGTPTIITEPGTPGRELVARKGKLTATGISRSGIAAFNVAESPFGGYDLKIIKAVQSRWFALVYKLGMERAGMVTIHFYLLADGMLLSDQRGNPLMEIKDNTTDNFSALICEKAIIESGPFDPLPDNLHALVGKEPREASFTFYY